MRELLRNRLYLRLTLLALGTAIVSSWTNFGHLCGDEYSQILEFAAWKLGHVDHADLRLWEFDSRMRPSIQAWGVVAVFRFLQLFTPEASPFLASYLLNLFGGLLSIVSILVFTGAFIRRIAPRFRDWFIILSLFSWLVLYTNTHFNSENISGHLLLLATGILYAASETHNRLRIITAGLILGLSFSCRFQLGFAITGLLAWFFLFSLRGGIFGRWLLLCAALLLSVVLSGTLADYLFYGEFVIAPFNYYVQNLATGNMDRCSGTSPWYAYLPLVCMYLPFGPVYVASVINHLIRHRSDILTFIIAPFILFHLMIGHKEVRFLLPLLGFMPVVMMTALDDVLKWRPGIAKSLPLAVKAVWIINLLGCLTLLFPSATEIGAWKFIHDRYRDPAILYFDASRHQKLLYYRRPSLQVIPVNQGDPTPCPPGYYCLLAVDANRKGPKPDLPRVYSLFPFGLDGVLPGAIVRSVGHFDVYELRRAKSGKLD